MSAGTKTSAPGLLSAMLAVQAAAPTLPKDKTNPHYKSKFTGLDTVVEHVRPLLAEHGLVWSTLPTTNEHGQPALRYVLAHAPTGEALEDMMPLLLSKADAQGLGSAITYARRYTLCAVLNLVADDDDDGNAAGQPAGRVQPGKPSDKQLDYFKSLWKRANPNDKVARAMLAKVEADGVDHTQPGWSAALDRQQVSQLIEILKGGVLPTGESDIPSDLEQPPPYDGPYDDLPFDAVGAEHES